MAPSAKLLYELDYGMVYLVKGTLAQCQWELRSRCEIRHIVYPSKQDIIDLTISSFLEDDRQTVILIPKNYDIPVVSSVDPDTRIFIVLAQPNGEVPEAANKLYKTKTKCIQPVNILNRNRRNDTEIQRALYRIEDPKAQEIVFKAYKLFPQTMVYKLRSGQYKEELETEEHKTGKAKLYLDSLLTNDWYFVWREIENKDVWRFFWIPREPKDSFMYRFLTGLNNSREHRGFCPSLWPFLEMCVSNSRTTNEMKMKLFVFASWVRASSTCFATPQKKGLYKYAGRGSYVGYSFEPSDQALSHLFSILSYPIFTI